MQFIFNAINAVIKNWKLFAVLFGLGGTVTVLGAIPGTENVSNILGQQITAVKQQIGTAASPTIVQ